MHCNAIVKCTHGETKGWDQRAQEGCATGMVCLNRPARNVRFLIDDVRASFGWVGCIVSWSMIVTLEQSSPPSSLMRYVRWNGRATAGEGRKCCESVEDRWGEGALLVSC